MVSKHWKSNVKNAFQLWNEKMKSIFLFLIVLILGEHTYFSNQEHFGSIWPFVLFDSLSFQIY